MKDGGGLGRQSSSLKLRLSSDAGMLGCPPLADEGMRFWGWWSGQVSGAYIFL